MRTYELMFIIDPRLSDEEVVALSDEFKQLIETGGGTVSREESWGKRRLAYPIQKLNEGRYVLFHLQLDGENPLPLVEQRMRQNDKVLRYLTVRTDKNRRRGAAEPPKAVEAEEAEGAAEEKAS